MSPFHETTAGAVALPAHPHPAGQQTRRPAHTRTYPCPRCASFTMRRSRISSAADVLLLPLSIAPYRCHRCFHRFRRLLPVMWFVSHR